MEETRAVTLAKNGNKTEDIWMTEFQRIAGPDATVSDEAATLLHTLRQDSYKESATT